LRERWPRASLLCVSRRTTLRASDDDRERVAERLRAAAVEGRLLAHELEERLATALRARTYGELDAVVADLPGKAVARRTGSLAARAGVAVGVALAVVTVVAVVAAAIFAVAGAWLIWMIFAWVLFGTRRRRGRYSRRPAYGTRVSRGRAGPPSAAPRPFS